MHNDEIIKALATLDQAFEKLAHTQEQLAAVMETASADALVRLREFEQAIAEPFELSENPDF